MVPRDYRYRCFDDCTHVSLHSRSRAKSFFIQDTCQSLCAEYTAGSERREFDKKLQFELASRNKIVIL